MYIKYHTTKYISRLFVQLFLQRQWLKNFFFLLGLSFLRKEKTDAENTRFAENVFKYSSSNASNAMFILDGVISIEEKWRLTVKL